MNKLQSHLDRLRPEHNWLDYSICADIEWLCRDNQFEISDIIDIFCFLNLRPYVGPFLPLKGEKRRICYLINRLSEYVTVVNKLASLQLVEPETLVKLSELQQNRLVAEYWEKKITEECGIDYSSEYIRHCTECGQRICGGRIQSKVNEKFTNDLNVILKKYEKTNVNNR